jgi:hypothetical protein
MPFKKSNQVRCLLFALFGAWAFFSSCTASAEVRSYRYELNLRSGDSRFAGEIKRNVSQGPRFDVEQDSRGRTLNITEYQNGNKVGRRVFHFEGGASLPSSLDIYKQGEVFAKTRIERNSRGESIRIEYLSVQGERTGDQTRTYFEDHVDWTKHNAEGKTTYRGTQFFSSLGVKIRAVDYLDEKTSIETAYDPDTGQQKVEKQFVNAELKVTTRYSYDENGSLTRNDLYNSDGRWYGATEYREGLKTRRILKFSSGDKVETIFSYDSKRVSTEARFSVNDHLICVFKFERYPNGSLKRTLAVGPTGDLYAEFPDHYVDSVQHDGSTTSEISGTVIYKHGKWW